MCGRFTQTASGEELARALELESAPSRAPRFNVAPSQPVAVVVQAPDGARRLAEHRWGLVPFWAKDAAIGNRLINARAETLHEKPAFREAFRRRRCLVPADGFYEWQRGDPPRQPFHIRPRAAGPFAIAALWESWQPAAKQAPLLSCTLITTEANRELSALHDRMPVILPPEHWPAWLAEGGDERALQRALAPSPDGSLELVPVSQRVNDPRNDDPSLLEPLAPERVVRAPQQQSLFDLD